MDIKAIEEKIAPQREQNENVYEIRLTNNKEELIQVTYKGIRLKGIVSVEIETLEGSPVIKLAMRPDFVLCGISFNLPPQNQCL